jgi:hypothetical protein
MNIHDVCCLGVPAVFAKADDAFASVMADLATAVTASLTRPVRERLALPT